MASTMTQNLGIGSSPSFAAPFVTGVATGNLLMTHPFTQQVIGIPGGSDGAIPTGSSVDNFYSNGFITGSSNVTVTNGSHTIALNTIQNIATTSTPTFANLIDSGLTVTRLVASDASKQLQSVTIANSNGCNSSFAGSTLTASMTQDLATTASPTFNNITANGTVNTDNIVSRAGDLKINPVSSGFGIFIGHDSASSAVIVGPGSTSCLFRVQNTTATNFDVNNAVVTTKNNTLDDGAGNMKVNALTATKLVASDGSEQLQSVTIVNTNGCNSSFAGSTFTNTMTQDLTTSGSPTFANITDSGIVGQSVVLTNS